MADLASFLSHGQIDYRLLGEKILAKREAEGLGLREAAEQCGISYSTLSRLERTTARPDFETLQGIVTWLGVSPSLLLMGRQPIRAHLRAQKNLVPSTAAVLAEAASTCQSLLYQAGDDVVETSAVGESRSKRPYRSLRRSTRERLAVQFRSAIKWDLDRPLDPFSLEVKGASVKRLDEIPGLPSELVGSLLGSEAARWSAMTIPVNDAESLWLIVLNSRHTIERQRATLMEEYCHIFLDHQMTTLSHLEGQTFRDYDEAQEKDAYALGCAILVPQQPLSKRVGQAQSAESIAGHFGVSHQLVEYRIKVTGAWYEYKFGQQVKPSTL